MFEKIASIIANKLEIAQDGLTMDTDIKFDLRADSVDVLEIIMEIENEFGILIEEGFETYATKIGDYVSYVENHLV